jgi:hypothetical protein
MLQRWQLITKEKIQTKLNKRKLICGFRLKKTHTFCFEKKKEVTKRFQNPYKRELLSNSSINI